VGQEWCAAIAFARVDPRQNPNVRSTDGDVYMKAMIVAFASLRRWNPTLELVLVTDTPIGESFGSLFESLGVEIRSVPFSHRPPEGLTTTFAASLYQFDAMGVCQNSTLFLDPDILCVRPLTSLISAVGIDRVGALPIGYPVDRIVNGLSRRQAAAIHAALGESDDVPIHYGGECFAIPEGVREHVLSRSERAWQDSIELWKAGRLHLVTEEHVMSYALRGVDVLALDPYVKRIWTAARFRNVTGTEDGLALWHVPAEKGRGFSSLFGKAADRSSWFWTSKEAAWRSRAARSLGIWNRTPQRLVRDAAGRAIEVAQGQWGGAGRGGQAYR
jgi:hypothetical protein